MIGPVSILIVDDHTLFAEGLIEIIKSISYSRKIINCPSLARATEELHTNKYDYVLLDLMMPETDNVMMEHFVMEQRKRNPNLILIVISSVVDLRIIKRYFDLGINGYVSKISNRNELKAALHKTYLGQKYISADLRKAQSENKDTADRAILTKKELQILSFIAAGHTVRKTAELLFLSPYTVMAHRRNIMRKLDLHSGPELVKYAFENKLV